MLRNWDIIRKILLKIEQLPTEDSTFTSNELEGVDSESVAYHMRLLLESGLIIGGCREALGPPLCHASRLTWEGHEFLDKIKNEALWLKIKTTARTKSVELSFSVIKDLAITLITSLIQS